MSANHVPSAAGTAPAPAWKDDLLASIVVFLVALPLCMGVAIASGFPPERAAAAGIISGIIGGVVVGLLSGCPLQVTGPAAGLAIIVGQLLDEHGAVAFGLIVLIAGAVQILAGVCRLGQWFRAVSPAIIQGMLAGIGVLIFAGQFHVMIDDKAPGTGHEHGGLINLYTIPEAVWKGLTEEVHQGAALVGILTILAILGWSYLAPKKLKAFPSPLFGVCVGTLLAVLFTTFGLTTKRIEVPALLTDAVLLPTWDILPLLLDRSILIAGLTVAFIASAESLLTATAVDAMQQRSPRTNYEREMAAQGIGNVLCGLLSVLPVTGVIVRSAANVQAGGRTRLSTVLHGLWLLVLAVAFASLLRFVPVSSLAAVLVYTGCKLMSPKVALSLWKYGKGEVAVYLATLIVVVSFDLLAGIAVGLVLALFQLVYRFSHLVIRIEDQPEQHRTILHLEGAATFLRLPKLAAALQEIPADTELHLHIEKLDHIDHACLDLLMNWEKQHEAAGGRLVIDWDKLTARFRRANGNGSARRDVAVANGDGQLVLDRTAH